MIIGLDIHACVSYQQKLKERRRLDSGVKFAKR